MAWRSGLKRGIRELEHVRGGADRGPAGQEGGMKSFCVWCLKRDILKTPICGCMRIWNPAES